VTSRFLCAAMAATALSLVACGCTATSADNPVAAQTTGSTAAASLPDPMPSDLPVGARILLHQQGSGTTVLDLTSLVGSAKTVNVRWTCVGDGGVNIADGASRTIVGGGCASTAAGATYLGGTVPLSVVSSLRWTLQADTATHWRISVTTVP
jgi:hypothetical protein